MISNIYLLSCNARFIDQRTTPKREQRKFLATLAGRFGQLLNGYRFWCTSPGAWSFAMDRFGTILIVDDDKDVRESLRALLESAGYAVRAYLSAKSLLSDDIAGCGCLITDVRMPGMDGLQLQEEIGKRDIGLPVIVITGHGDIALAVQAMQAGAVDFLVKPFDEEAILSSVRRALAFSERRYDRSTVARAAQESLALLTPRERDVFEQLVAGRSNRAAGVELNISFRTVEVHRAHIFKKMKVHSLPDLVRISIGAAA